MERDVAGELRHVVSKMGPTALAWVLLCVHSGETAALALPHGDVAIHAPSNLRSSSHSLRRLMGHKRVPQVSWIPSGATEDLNWKRAPNGLGASGFYGDVFNQGFGAFSPVKRSKQFKKSRPKTTTDELYDVDDLGSGSRTLEEVKRRPEMTASGFYDDVFRGGIGHFEPMKRRPEMSASGFYDDVFRGDMGHFEPMKRRPEMSASGFYDDVFRGDMGHFEPMKRRSKMSAHGCYDDVFKGDIGHFEPIRRKPEVPESRFYRAIFKGDSDRFGTMERISERKKTEEAPHRSGHLSHAVLPPSQPPRMEDQSRTERSMDDETMSAKGLRSELPSGALEEFDRRLAP